MKKIEHFQICSVCIVNYHCHPFSIEISYASYFAKINIVEFWNELELIREMMYAMSI